MPNEGYTIQPMLAVDPSTGQEVLSYEHAQVENHGDKLQQIDEFQRGQQFYENTAGEVRSLYADAPDLIYRDDPAFDTPTEEPEAFDNDYVEAVYGYEYYQQMVEWAADNIDSTWIENYNQLIDDGNHVAAKEAAAALYKVYCLEMEAN